MGSGAFRALGVFVAQGLPKRVLFIDDDPTIAEGLEGPMLKHGVELMRAADLETALYLFNQKKFDVVCVELEFGPLTGLALVQKLRANDNPERANCGILVTCGKNVKKSDMVLLDELGDLEFAEKPLTEIKLLPFLQRAFERRNLRENLEETRTLIYDTMKNTNDVDQALSILNKRMPELNDEKVEIMSDLLESAGRFDEAMNLFDTLLQKNPNDVRSLNAKGRLLLKTGRAQAARQFLEQAHSLAPYNIDRTATMSKMYIELDEPDASVESMKDLIDLNPENKDMRFDLFEDLDNAGYQEHAVGLCKDSKTPPKEVVRHYNNKGVAFSRTGDTEMALEDYYRALKFYPKYKENFRIQFNIALAEANKKTLEGYQKAYEAITKCLELAPEFDKAQKVKPTIEAGLAKLKKSRINKESLC